MQNLKIRFQLHDLLFYLLLVFSFYFTRNNLCRLMMVVFFGYTMVKQLLNTRKVVFPFYIVGFAAFIGYGALNILFENVISASVAKTMVVSLLLNLMMIYAIVQYIYMQNDIPKTIRITEFGIFTTAVVVVILSLGTITEGRLGADTEINSNVLALLCVYGLILSMYLKKIEKLQGWGYWLRAGFYLAVILLTGSRKGLLMIVIAIVIISFFTGQRKIFRTLLIGSITVVTLYILIMNVDFLYNIVGVRVENLLNFLNEGSTADASLHDRNTLVDIGMAYVREKPWTGYGYDCFKLVSSMSGDGNVATGEVGYYSHNNYIELLFSGGIIGFVLYYIPVLYLLKKLFSGIRVNVCIPYLLAILISKLAIEYAYVSYYNRVDAYIIAIMLGCVLIASTQPKQPEPSSV